MRITRILEEYRASGKLVTLEKSSGEAGPPFKVKVITVAGFASEKRAREAYNAAIPTKTRSANDSNTDGAGGYTSPTPTAKRKKNAAETAKKGKGRE